MLRNSSKIFNPKKNYKIFIIETINIETMNVCGNLITMFNCIYVIAKYIQRMMI